MGSQTTSDTTHTKKNEAQTHCTHFENNYYRSQRDLLHLYNIINSHRTANANSIRLMPVFFSLSLR